MLYHLYHLYHHSVAYTRILSVLILVLYYVVLCVTLRVLQVHIEQHFWCDRLSCKQLLLSPTQQACCDQLTARTLQ